MFNDIQLQCFQEVIESHGLTIDLFMLFSEENSNVFPTLLSAAAMSE